MIDWIIRMLRYPLVLTTDSKGAIKSPFQWSEKASQWSLSTLGAINGILPYFGICLVAHWDDETGQGLRLSIKRPWW